jgi:hypothetical protein
MRVVQPVLDLPLTLPAGCRDRYPADPTRLAALAAHNGVVGPCARLVTTLSALGER